MPGSLDSQRELPPVREGSEPLQAAPAMNTRKRTIPGDSSAAPAHRLPPCLPPPACFKSPCSCCSEAQSSRENTFVMHLPLSTTPYCRR